MKRFFTKVRMTAFIALMVMLAPMHLSAQNVPPTGGDVKGEWQKGPNQSWFIQWNYALAEARTKNKAIFVLSTGSDWCGWCKVLKKNVLDQKEFLDFADKNLSLLYLDSPNKNKLCPEQQQHNDYVRQSLGFGGGVPNVMIFSHQGDYLGKITGGGLKLDEYLVKLNEILGSTGKAISSARGKDLFTKGYIREVAAAKPGATPSAAVPPKEDATPQQFKAKIIGIAVADKNADERKLTYSPIDTHVTVSRTQRVFFQVEYDFPDGYAGFIWVRAVEKYSGMGGNPSGQYKGQGIAYGFLTHPASNAHMAQVKVRTNSSPKIGDTPGWTIITQDVNVDFD